MLNPEQAKEQLQAIRIKDWHSQRAASIANLPETLRKLGWGILGRNSDGELFVKYDETRFSDTCIDFWASNQARDAALKQLDALSVQERLSSQ